MTEATGDGSKRGNVRATGAAPVGRHEWPRTPGEIPHSSGKFPGGAWSGASTGGGIDTGRARRRERGGSVTIHAPATRAMNSQAGR
jgi:hypothetical protein